MRSGTVLCHVKRVRDSEPFATVWVRCHELGGGRWSFHAPKGPDNRIIYKRGGGGVHFKLLPKTFTPDPWPKEDT